VVEIKKRTSQTLLLVLFLGLIIFSAFPYSVKASHGIDSDNYPFDDNDIDTFNENDSFSMKLSGDASFDSETSNVGYPEYAVYGTGTTTNWDAYTPNQYDYKDTTITLTAKDYAESNTVTGSLDDGNSYYYSKPTGATYQNDITVTPTYWNVKTEDSYSVPTDSSSDDDRSNGCNRGHENYDDNHGRADDGDWYTTGGENPENEIVDGDHRFSEVCLAGESTWVKSRCSVYDRLDIVASPYWILTDIWVDIGVWTENHDFLADGNEVEAQFYMYHGDTKHTLDSREEEASSNSGHKEIEPSELFGSMDEFNPSYGGWTQHFYYKSDKHYDIPDASLSYWARSWEGGKPVFRFELRTYAWHNWLWEDTETYAVITELDVRYQLYWNGAGDFAGSDTTLRNALLKTRMYNGGSGIWEYGSTTDGITSFIPDFQDRTTDSLQVQSDGYSKIQNIDINYRIDRTAWYDSASVNDVVLQFSPNQGSSWITLAPTGNSWVIYSPNIKSEAWYIDNALKLYFKATSYTTGILGMSFTYTIDHSSVNWTVNAHTTNFIGTQNFTQAQGRFIDEHWTGIEFFNAPFIEYATIGVIGLSLTEKFIERNENQSLLYYYSDFSTLDEYWYANSDENIDISWNTDNTIPSIIDYNKVNSTIEMKPTLFNVTASDDISDIREGYVILSNSTETTKTEESEIYYLDINEIGEQQEWFYTGIDALTTISNIGQGSLIASANQFINYSYVTDIYNFSSINLANINEGAFVSKIRLNITGFMNSLVTDQPNISINYGDGWEKEQELNLPLMTVDFDFPEWNVTLNQTQLDDLQVRIKAPSLANGVVQDIDYIVAEIIVNYTQVKANVSFYDSYNLTNYIDNNGERTLYDYLHIKSGNFTYWYLVRDKSGNWRTTKPLNLTVIPGEINITFIKLENYEYGTTNNRLVANITDTVGDSWMVFIDGFKVFSGSWVTTPYQINVSIDGYTLGIHTISVYANNTLGREGYNASRFVVFQKGQFITTPTNTSKGECTPNITLTWVAIDENPRNYTIYRNNTEIQSGAWLGLTPIKHEVDLSNLGQNVYYVYKCVIEDNHNVTNTDYFGLWIYPVNPVISDEKGGLLYEDEDATVIWDVSDGYLLRFEVYEFDTTWVLIHNESISKNANEISYTIDGDNFLPEDHQPTDYIIKTVIIDKYLNNNSDTINFTTIAHPPLVEDFPDGFYYSNDEEAEIDWYIEDANLLRYWITINTSKGEKIIEEGDLLGETSGNIILNLYKLELEEGKHIITLYVEDTYGNIVNDTVEAENIGEQAGIEINIMGLVTWLIVGFVAVFSLYAVSKSDYWERAEQKQKSYVIGGTIGLTAVLLIILTVFGVFPVTFTQLGDLVAQTEANLGEYGLLILILGVAGGTIAGITLLYYLMKRRQKQI